jgi:hypothetical protein
MWLYLLDQAGASCNMALSGWRLLAINMRALSSPEFSEAIPAENRDVALDALHATRGSPSVAPPEHFYTESVGQRAHFSDQSECLVTQLHSTKEGAMPILNATAIARKNVCWRL